MQPFAKALVLFSFLWNTSAQASDWRVILERAGFMGTLAAGASYEWLPEHAIDVTLGGYLIEQEIFYQTNIAYRYSRWNSPTNGNIWRPLQFGIFAVYALNSDRYFMRSPDKYPSKGYYDETAFRYGLEFGTTYTFLPSGFGIGYRIRIFDNGLTAMFNNSNRDVQYYISSGVTLQYLF
ncbi:hypothetical protein [Bdellovibrio sp. KM01]|uniref:hypothetical protein n=1 Tax=Bdellovibrio sp. KM01 TaxID=2748865 RepID=UPI0021053EC8|nr:hypothetical protein [Bdellovibrio sp. KM01]